ncbi:MAG: hypothetical protein V3T21_01285 [Candidatus Margulisiibacteriota bacterium]
MKPGGIHLRPRPFRVSIVKGDAKRPRLRRGFAFVHKQFKAELNQGCIQEKMVQLMLRIEWEHRKLGELPQLEISMILQPRLWLDESSTAPVLWDKVGRGRHWLGIQMNNARHNFFLNFKDPDKDLPGFHAFFYRAWRELHIYPDFSYEVISEVSMLFKMNNALRRLMAQVRPGDLAGV